ncbi:hypothetical protein O3M35_007544 [Rhynocoris fuscipes]|uniref:Uncharacterized protein n=1 Tax=Rhynocoris fuscipes TaxID=488301 RepID=A0AAW1DCG6_9HEMI
MRILFFTVLMLAVSAVERHRIPDSRRDFPRRLIHPDDLKLGAYPLLERNFAYKPIDRTNSFIISPYTTKTIVIPPSSLYRTYFLTTPKYSHSSQILAKPIFVTRFSPTLNPVSNINNPIPHSQLLAISLLNKPQAIPFTKQRLLKPQKELHKKILYHSPNFVPVVRKTPVKRPVTGQPVLRNRLTDAKVSRRKVFKYPYHTHDFGRWRKRIPQRRLPLILKIPTTALSLVKRIFTI